jgi:predicted nucleotidyltransferase
VEIFTHPQSQGGKMELKVQIPQKFLKEFCTKHHIIKLALFGSVLTNQFSETSDVDILVEFEPQHIPGLFAFVGMKEELSQQLGREVDLKTPGSISQSFREEVLRQSYLIYGKEGFR